MGYNTTVVVMNDALSFIEKDPEFDKNLARAIMEAQRGKPVDVAARHANGIHCNAATVIESHHASHDEWVKVGGNTGSVIPWEDRFEAEDAIRRRNKREAKKRAAQT